MVLDMDVNSNMVDWLWLVLDYLLDKDFSMDLVEGGIHTMDLVDLVDRVVSQMGLNKMSGTQSVFVECIRAELPPLTEEGDGPGHR